MKVRVFEKEFVAEDICRLELVSESGAPLPAFSAGAHIDLKARNGLTRQYSLCNAPNERHRYVVAVLRAPDSRGGSLAMHEIGKGDVIEISEPRNNFPLSAEASHTVLFAGGIGITPILCMARALKATNKSFEFHYSAREFGRMAFRRELEAEFPDQAHFYLDTDDSDKRLDFSKVLRNPEIGKHLYVCGPAGFIEATLGNAKQLGWKDENIHREYFSQVKSEHVDYVRFSVVVKSNGATVEVGPTESIAEALARIGVNVPLSCEQGICGTCLTKVAEGIPAHYDSYLTDSEKSANDQMLLCCSRAKTERLVLDI